jgi:hypothetical protein
MKRKSIFSIGSFVTIIVAVVFYNLSLNIQREGSLSSILVENLEALSQESEYQMVQYIIDEGIGTITIYDDYPSHYSTCRGITCLLVERNCVGTGYLGCISGLYIKTDQCTWFDDCNYGIYV